jgi:hypothetical protein
MDLHKWAGKLAPAVPSELVMDAFDLARDIRSLDMRASPHDLRARLRARPHRDAPRERRGPSPSSVLSPSGQALRARLLAAMDLILLDAPRRPG